MKNINRLLRVLDRAVFNDDSDLGYDGIMTGINLLVILVKDYDGDIDWHTGEELNCTLDDFIVGAYWHFTDYHRGQWSREYATLSTLGSIYNPGMECCNDDNPVYLALADIAEAY